MHQPVKASYDYDSGLSNLTFLKDKKCNFDTCFICQELGKVDLLDYPIKVVIKFLIRGSIVWPTGGNPGYALVSGRDPITKKIRIIEECPFTSVGTVDGKKGLNYFIQKNIERYRCLYYFYVKSEEHRRFFIQTLREKILKTKPLFLQAVYASTNKQNIDNLVNEYAKLNKMAIDENYDYQKWLSENDTQKIGNLATQYIEYTKGMAIDEDRFPAVKALRALIAGYERLYP